MTEIKKQLTKIKRMQINFNKGEKFLVEIQKLQDMLPLLSPSDKKLAIDELLKITDDGLLRMKEKLIAYKLKQHAPIIHVGEVSYDLKEWATVSQYQKLFGYKNPQSVYNKLARGSIKNTDVAYIPSLDIRLIRLPL